MLTIGLPAIAVEAVANGYVIQFARKRTEEEKKRGSGRIYVGLIAKTDEELLTGIKEAVAAMERE